jgi:predicted transcriptional regulator
VRNFSKTSKESRLVLLIVTCVPFTYHSSFRWLYPSLKVITSEKAASLAFEYRFILEHVLRYGIYSKRMKYRSRLEIIASMLQVASSGDASRTTIMYKSFISHAQLKEFLSFLLHKDLIVEYHKGEGKSHREERTSLYKTTEKGIYLMHLYNEMNDLLELQKDVP